MSLPTIHGTGTLLTDPKTGPTRTGGTWTNAVVRFQAWKKTDAGWEEGDTVVASCIAFGDAATVLATFGKGDSVEVRGTCGLGEWNGKPQLKLTVAACRAPVKVAA
jgi:single-stranded DNA-binding protein